MRGVAPDLIVYFGDLYWRSVGPSAAEKYTPLRMTPGRMALTMRRMEFSFSGRREMGFRVDGKSKGCGSPTLRQRFCNYLAYRFRKIWRARRLTWSFADSSGDKNSPRGQYGICLLLLQPSLRSEETPQGSHHRFGCSDVDTHPSLDRRRWHAEPGKVNEEQVCPDPSSRFFRQLLHRPGHRS